MAGLSGFGKGLGESLGGGGPFTGGSSSAGAHGTTLDGSGWVVNMGGTQVASASPTKTQTDPVSASAAPQVAAASMGGVIPLLMLGGVALMILRKRKH